jgi:hypothetical protein
MKQARETLTGTRSFFHKEGIREQSIWMERRGLTQVTYSWEGGEVYARVEQCGAEGRWHEVDLLWGGDVEAVAGRARAIMERAEGVRLGIEAA